MRPLPGRCTTSPDEAELTIERPTLACSDAAADRRCAAFRELKVFIADRCTIVDEYRGR